jgi:hypothetical protein
MPSIISKVDILNVTVFGLLHFGDTAYTTPKTLSKTGEGSGASNTGGLILANNGGSGTNYIIPHVIEQPIIGNR